MKTWILIAVMIATFGLYGCNTTRGVGEDIEATGDAISDAAEETEEDLEQRRDRD